jgi:polysaccharide pyruvyl transferase WcaK-like protein
MILHYSSPQCCLDQVAVVGGNRHMMPSELRLLIRLLLSLRLTAMLGKMIIVLGQGVSAPFEPAQWRWA